MVQTKKPIKKKNTSKKAVATSKIANKVVHKKSVSKTNIHKSVPKKNETNNFWKWTIGSLIVLIVILLFIIAVSMFKPQNSQTKNPSTNNSTIKTTNSAGYSLTVVTRSDVSNLAPFVAQIKRNLFPNLKVVEYTLTSKQGKKIQGQINAQKVPIMLFSKNIDSSKVWISQNLSTAFKLVSINGISYYYLNPKVVQISQKINQTPPPITKAGVLVGNPNANVTIVEFSDYECPYCGIAEGVPSLVKQFSSRNPNYVAPIPAIYKNYINTGKVNLVFYSFPLTSIHPNSMAGANIALCALDQGTSKWEKFHFALFMQRDLWINNDQYNPNVLKAFDSIAKSSNSGLNITQLNSCFTAKKHENLVKSSIQLGLQYGVSGTPTFFIARYGKNFTQPSTSKIIVGAQPYSVFETAINAALSK